jgi:hypothetical protein
LNGSLTLHMRHIPCVKPHCVPVVGATAYSEAMTRRQPAGNWLTTSLYWIARGTRRTAAGCLRHASGGGVTHALDRGEHGLETNISVTIFVNGSAR